jgi:predicted DNA binding protein
VADETMSVLVEVEVSADEFEWGRVFAGLESEARIELESLVPLSGVMTPLVWIENGTHDSLGSRIGGHPTVTAVERLERLSERSLYAIEWALDYDHLFRYFRDNAVHLLSVTGSPETWQFTVRFQTHHALSTFDEYCENSQISIEVLRVYNLPEQQSDQAFGITQPQQEALMLAVREGYYDIPRQCDTKGLAEQLDISDQAVTERLRRAIATLTRNALMGEQL